MGEIVNLRRARKTKARAEASTAAAGNRALYGRTAGEKERDRLETERLARAIEGAKRTDD